jgi:hypothetical protein
MCGIAGSALAPDRRFAGETRAVRAMTEALLHRGPDGSLVLADEENGVRFGHTRLAADRLGTPHQEVLVQSSDLGETLFPLVEDRFARSSIHERGFFDRRETRRLFDAHRRGSRAAFDPIGTLFVLGLWHDRWIAGRRGA